MDQLIDAIKKFAGSFVTTIIVMSYLKAEILKLVDGINQLIHIDPSTIIKPRLNLQSWLSKMALPSSPFKNA